MASATNGLSEKEKKADLKEAAANTKHHRGVARRIAKKAAKPSFKIVAPGVRTNSSRSAEKRFEVICSFYVGGFPSVSQAEAAREKFIRKVDKLRHSA